MTWYTNNNFESGYSIFQVSERTFETIEIPTHWEVHGDVCLLPQGSFESDTWRQNKADHELNSDEEHEVSLFRRVCRVLGVERLARKSVIANDDFRSPKVELLYGFSEGKG